MAALLRGISFPFRKGTGAFPATATGDQLVKEDLYQLITTGIGARVMRPLFGTNVYSFIFEANDDVLATLIQAEVQSAIAKYEPRVAVEDIGTFRTDSEVVVVISYTIVATGNRDAVDLRYSTP